MIEGIIPSNKKILDDKIKELTNGFTKMLELAKLVKKAAEDRDGKKVGGLLKQIRQINTGLVIPSDGFANVLGN